MKRVLCIVGKMDVGGAETFLMKIYRKLNKLEYQFDFCVFSQDVGFYDDEIAIAGGVIHHASLKTRNPFKSFNDVRKIVKKNKYNCVLRLATNSLSSIDLLASKLGGAEILALRACSANAGGGMASHMLHKIFKLLALYLPDIKIAPSKLSAEFMFGKRAVKKGVISFLNNGVDLDYYKFDKKSRTSFQEKFGISDKLVIGHAGSFKPEKNHRFILDVFNAVQKKNPNSVLLLAGDGELRSKTEKCAAELGLENNIYFLGFAKNISEFLAAIDIFILPSIYEGMPNVVIEAQAAGLPCVVSDTVTREANITGGVSYTSLLEPPEVWADCILAAAAKERTSMDNISKSFIEKGYDIDTVAWKFLQMIAST